jgi:hypothetical protein
MTSRYRQAVPAAKSVCLYLEHAGSGSLLGCISVSESTFDAQTSCWLDLQDMVYLHLQQHARWCVPSRSQLLRLFNEHNGPELTSVSAVSSCEVSARWWEFVQQLTHLFATQHTSTKVLVVMTYDDLDYGRSNLSHYWASLSDNAAWQDDKLCVMEATARDFYELDHASSSVREDIQVLYTALSYEVAAAASESMQDRQTRQHLRQYLSLARRPRQSSTRLSATDKTTCCKTHQTYDLQHVGDLLLLLLSRKPHQYCCLAKFSTRHYLTKVLHLFNDYNFALKAVQANPHCLSAFDKRKSFCKDRTIMLAAVQQDGTFLTQADQSLALDEELVATALKRCLNGPRFLLPYVDARLVDNSPKVAALMHENGYMLEHLVRRGSVIDRQTVLDQVAKCGSQLVYAQKHFRIYDKQVMLAAVKHNGFLLRKASPSLRSDRDVVLAAVTQAGAALQYADLLRSDKEIALVALAHDCTALYHISHSLQSDMQIIEAAVRQGAQYACTHEFDGPGLTTNAVNALLSDEMIMLGVACFPQLLAH